MKTRVMVVDGHASIRHMLGVAIAKEGPYEVVAEAATGVSAIQLLRKVSPRLIILDLMLPELNGVGLLQHLRANARDTRTLVFCGTNDRQLIMEALRIRPHGFVLKRDPWATLCEALRMVSSGCSYFSPFATDLLDDANAGESSDVLSSRERAIVQMVAEGHSNKQMAAQLGISAKTVEYHRAHVLEKLDVYDVAGLTIYAVRNRLVFVP